LLLHGDGTNGAQNNTFIDSSTNNFTITRNGNTTQGSLSPFGDRWSNFFDGAGDFLTTASSTSFGFGTGEFTFECWVFPTSNPANGPGTLLDLRSGALAEGFAVRLFSDLKVGAYIGPANTFVYSTGTVTLNTWTHIAVVRSGTTLTFFINGAASGTATVSNDLGSTWAARIGSNYTAGFDYFGYLSNYRIVKGTALYTANFTPSTTPLTAVSGTSLLTCQSNRLRDASSNNFTITRNGDVRVEKFSPFAPTAAYLPATEGGSAYFDGTGDSLTYPANTTTNFQSSNFTIEFWFYKTNSTTATIFSMPKDDSGTAFGGVRIDLQSTNNVRPLIANASNSGWASTAIGPGVFPLNSWNHYALVKSGTTITGYLNGVLDITLTGMPSSFTDVTFPPRLGFNNATDVLPFAGYVANFRIVKGTAVYTAAFTPPAAPVTAITNTSLLLNFTNGAIYDNAAMNVLETVGSESIATVEKKFGTGSINQPQGSYLFSVSALANEFRTGDFTVECWLYPFNSDLYGTIYSTEVGAQTNVDSTFTFTLNSSLIPLAGNRSAYQVTSSTALTANTWNHVAVTRSGTTMRIFVNGVLTGSGTSSTDFLAGGCSIGILPRSTSNTRINGYIDDFRVTKGVARYVANFTPPALPFPDQ